MVEGLDESGEEEIEFGDPDVDDSIGKFTVHGNHVYTLVKMLKSDLLNPEDSFILSGGGDDRALLWDF